MPYKFPTPRSRKSDLEITGLFGNEAKEPEEEPGIINGQKAASMLEWRVAKALWKLKRTFFYQYPLFGGRRTRGGYVIDFLIDGAPKSIPLEVQGERWHTGSFASDELRRKAMIESYLETSLRYVFENQLQNDDDALQAVRKAIGT